MDNRVKERVFGAVILVALFVIFLPMLFEGHSSSSRSRSPQSTIPDMAEAVESQELFLVTSKEEKLKTEVANQQQLLEEEQFDVSELKVIDDPTEKTVEPKVKAVKQETVVVPEPKPETVQSPEPKFKKEVVQAKAAPVVEKAEPKEAAKPKVQAKPLDAWSVQLATFANRANADSLVKKLKSRGFAAYTQKVPTQSRSLTWVMVGPELNREDALTLKDKIQSRFKLKGMVVRYKPNNE